MPHQFKFVIHKISNSHFKNDVINWLSHLRSVGEMANTVTSQNEKDLSYTNENGHVGYMALTLS